jgi:hypothetical protein
MTTHKTISLGFLLLLTACGSTFDSDELQTWDCEFSGVCDGEYGSVSREMCESEDGLQGVEDFMSGLCGTGRLEMNCQPLEEECSVKTFDLDALEGTPTTFSPDELQSWDCSIVATCEGETNRMELGPVCDSESEIRSAEKRSQEAAKESCPGATAEYECEPLGTACKQT